jgi:hypothetical protein
MRQTSVFLATIRVWNSNKIDRRIRIRRGHVGVLVVVGGVSRGALLCVY